MNMVIKVVEKQVHSLKEIQERMRFCYKLSAEDIALLAKFYDEKKATSLTLSDEMFICIKHKPHCENKIFVYVQPQADGSVKLDCYDESVPMFPNTSAYFKFSNAFFDTVSTPIELACSENAEDMSKHNARLSRMLVESILYAEAVEPACFVKRKKKHDCILTEQFKSLVKRLVIVPAFTRTYSNGKKVKIGPYRYYRSEPKPKKSV